jgi:ClpX C4-type zinc finger
MSHKDPKAFEPVMGSQINVRCSFCGRHGHETGPMVEGPNVYICADCVVVASEMAKLYCKRVDGKLQPPVPTDLGETFEPSEAESS